MASSTSKGPQAKTTEPMNLIKVTYCSIQLGKILARDGFAKNYMGSKRAIFSFGACGWMDGWIYVIVFFGSRFFSHD